jgi:hypothetical protein
VNCDTIFYRAGAGASATGRGKLQPKREDLAADFLQMQRPSTIDATDD